MSSCLCFDKYEGKWHPKKAICVQANKHIGKRFPVILAARISSSNVSKHKGLTKSTKDLITGRHQESFTKSLVVNDCVTLLTARPNIFLVLKLK